MRASIKAGACALVACLCMAVGCGGKSEVKGKVTYQGKAVVWGTITLVDAAGGYYQGPIGLDGTFSIPDVPSGPVKIGVHSTNPDGSRGRPKDGGKVSGAVGGEKAEDDPRSKFKTASAPEPPRPEPGKWFAIPAKYSDPQTSGLTGDVRRGQPLDVELK